MTARLTFREKVDVCWQKQLRDKYVSEGTPPVPHLDVKRTKVKKVSRSFAKQIILKYEWLGAMYPNSKLHYGIFFGPFCAGVACISLSGCGIHLHKPFGIRQDELAMLVRGACVHWAPKGTNSKLVAWTCRLLKKETKAKLVIAYSDTDAGEIGTIYQACNWVYIGKGVSTKDWVSPGGIVRNRKLMNTLSRRGKGMRPTSFWREKLISEGWTMQSSNPKHRYVFILDKADDRLAARIESMSRLYPKRATSIASDAATNHVIEGGAIPTVALS